MTNDEARGPGSQDDERAREEMEMLGDLFAELSRSENTIAMRADGTMSVGSAVDRSSVTFGTIAPDGSWTFDPDGVADVIDAPDAPGDPGSVDSPAQKVPGTPRRSSWMPQGAGAWAGVRVADFASGVAGHLVRSPWYALRGLGVCVRGVGRWVMRREDDDQFAADLKAATSVQARSELRGRRARGRMLRAAVASAPIWAVWSWVEFGRWGFVPAAAVAVSFVGFAVAGWRDISLSRSPQERRARRRRPAPLSRPFVSEALEIAGCGSVPRPDGGKAAAVILSSSPVAGGEVMVIDLPAGVPVSKLVKRHEEFAGALGRPLECVVIEPQAHVSPQRFELFVAAKRLDEKGAPAWPGRKVRARSFFDPVPVGLDARGRTVLVPLFERHGATGGATGKGKTFTARLLLLWAAQDPRARLLIHNLRGGPDYLGFAPVAHTLRSGGSPGDLEALAQDLRDLVAEIERRGRVLSRMPSARVPEGKLTEDVASDDGMGPVVLLVDEAQRAFTAGKLGDEIAAMLEDVARTGRAVGISVQLVTQGGKAGAIPVGILDQCTGRIVHGVTTIAEGNILAGSDAHGRGYRAVDIAAPGIAYVGVAGGEMVRTAMAKVDLPEVERIASAAAELRRAAGTLSGMAAGDVAGDDHDGGMATFLTDVLAVWPADERERPWRNAKSDLLAARLAERFPDPYADLTGDDGGAIVSRRMREAGVKVSSQRTPAGEGRGVKRVDVERAATALGG